MSYVRQASLIEKLLVGLVAAIHFIFALGEMFLWKPLLADRLLAGLTGATEEVRAPVLTYTGQFAFNMGLYNTFLAVGLVLALRDLGMRHNRALARLFLAFIVVAGAVGGLTVSTNIFLLQSIPAIVALAAFHFSGRDTKDYSHKQVI